MVTKVWMDGTGHGMNVGMDAKERRYAVIVKPKDASVRMTREQVKEKVMRDVSKALNVRMRAMRKTRSGGIAIKTAKLKVN